MYTVSLQIAGKEFIGQGRSQNQARNTAASSAVKELQKNPLKPDDVMKYKRSTGATSSTNEKTGSSSAATSSSQKESSQNASRTSTAHKVGKVGDASTTEGEKSSAEENSVKVKPAISQVYELAQRMNLPVVFEENFQEGGSGGNAFHSGGPKSFTVKCKVGKSSFEGFEVITMTVNDVFNVIYYKPGTTQVGPARRVQITNEGTVVVKFWIFRQKLI